MKVSTWEVEVGEASSLHKAGWVECAEFIVGEVQAKGGGNKPLQAGSPQLRESIAAQVQRGKACKGWKVKKVVR